MSLVCIHTSRALAELRVAGLNGWHRESMLTPVTFEMEDVEVDHLFAAVEMGYDAETDKAIEDHVRNTLIYDYHERRYNNLLARSKERIEELERQVKCPKCGTEVWVGTVLRGYCEGWFGRDGYGDKTVEAVGSDWVLVRLGQYVLTATFDGSAELDACMHRWAAEKAPGDE
jgi:hypothetical protein